MTQWIQAEDFTLATAAKITDVHFWSVEGQSSYQGSVSWGFYSNVGGVPGALIASGNTSAVTRTATGNSLFFGTEFLNDFDILPVSLAAGSYFLGLHNGLSSVDSRSEYYWETQSTSVGANGQEDVSPFGVGSWFDNGHEHAFYLTGEATTNPVPEPSSIALVGLAMCGIGIARRRKSA
jgi:hypothetical protein